MGEELEDRPVAWRVVGGGEPSPAEIAAITIALTPVVVEIADDDESTDTAGVSHWQRAAIVDAVGGRPAHSWQDLVQGRFGLGFVGDVAGRR